MMVAVDTLYMSSHFCRTGTGKYINHLLEASLKIIAREQLDFVFHGFAAPDENWANNGFRSPRLHVHKSRSLRHRRAWLLGGMAMQARRMRPDVVFVPTAHSSLPYPRLPWVCTILDSMPARLPARFVEVSRVAHLATWVNAKVATKILTISEWSKNDLVDIYGIDPEKVEVTYLGYDKKVYNQAVPDAEASRALLSRLGIRRPFIVHHGMVQIRKNLNRLICSWDLLRRRRPSLDAQLVLIGGMGKGHEEILAAQKNAAHPEDVIFTGALPDHELATVVKNASLCVIPSLYEGFCLPLVESMACGVPTVASRSSCLPEISGEVLEYFDPYSVEEMAEVIHRAFEDSDLRLRLRCKGLARASEFSWERCARETLRVLQKAAA